MDARRMRVEIIRFGLLIIITIGLVSIATRHGDHHHNVSSSGRAGTPSAGASAGASQSPSAGSQASGGSTPTPGSTGSTGGQGSHSHSQTAGAGGSGVASGSTGTQQVPTLPRTGAAQAVDLSGLAALLIVAGTLTVRMSRRSVP